MATRKSNGRPRVPLCMAEAMHALNKAKGKLAKTQGEWQRWWKRCRRAFGALVKLDQRCRRLSKDIGGLQEWINDHQAHDPD